MMEGNGEMEDNGEREGDGEMEWNREKTGSGERETDRQRQREIISTWVSATHM